MEVYNDSYREFPCHNGAARLVVKTAGSSAVTFPVEGGKVRMDTGSLPAGEYVGVWMDAAGGILARLSLTILQNPATADADADLRSPARRALDAINAVLADRAAAPNGRVKVGDKEIEYASLADLISLRNFYRKEVRKEEGKSATLNHEILVYKGV